MAEQIPAANNRPRVPRKRPQRLNLPFTKRKRDIGTWVYDNRAGLCAMLIAYLLVAIVFVGSKVIVRTPVNTAGIILDMRTLEELRQEKQRLEREVRLRQQSRDDDNAYIRNVLSNEGADLRDDRNTDVSSIRDRADNLDSKMQSNRDAWERGMREIASMKNSKGDGEDVSKNDSRAKGRVTVSFSLINPTRYSVEVPVPAYRCERGGEVVVNITVNRGGDVVSAAVDRGLSDSDNCMHETALEAARRSRFNLDGSAPERQSGTITYLFIPQ